MNELKKSFTEWVGYFEKRLDKIDGKLKTLEEGQKKMAPEEVAALKNAFADYKSSVNSVVAKLTEKVDALAAQVAASAADDTAALQALATDIATAKTELPAV